MKGIESVDRGIDTSAISLLPEISPDILPLFELSCIECTNPKTQATV